jgi:hypothetical protein
VGYTDSNNLYAYLNNNPINFIDPYGLWAITVGAYDIFGGAFSYGRTTGGRSFIRIRIGLGYGGGISFNPFTKPAGYKCEKDTGLMNMDGGFFAELGVGFGPFGFETGANVGIHSQNYPSDLYGYEKGFNFPKPKFSWSERWRLKGGISSGFEFFFY